MLNCKELLVMARDYLNDPNSTLMSDAALLRHINGFQVELWAQARLSNEDFTTQVAKDRWLYADFDQVFSDDTKINKALLSDKIGTAEVGNISKVYRSDTNPVRRIPHVSESNGAPEYNRDPDIDGNMEQDLAYSLSGGYLFIHGVLPADLKLSMYFEKPPADMFVGKVDAIATATSVGGVLDDDTVYTTVDFLFSENPVTGRMINESNYYQGSRFMRTSSTERQDTFLVIGGGGVDADSMTLSIHTPSSGLANGDEVAWVSSLPSEFHQTLAIGGAYRASMARQNMKLSQMLGQEKLRLQQLAVSMFEQRRTDASRNVIETGTGAAP